MFVRFRVEGIIVSDVHVDSRVRRTQRRLREAIVALIHEKSYPDIAVSEILERADVGRSAFYAHFRNKDALLASSIEQRLHATTVRTLPRTLACFGKALSFSFPVLEYVARHRRGAETKMGRHGRAVVHDRLQRVLVERIRDDVAAALRSDPERGPAIPPDLLTQHIASTFILVLNWWVDSKSSLSPREVDDLFLTLVAPALMSGAIA
jgi:AcrR family transcriptional regulator